MKNMNNERGSDRRSYWITVAIIAVAVVLVSCFVSVTVWQSLKLSLDIPGGDTLTAEFGEAISLPDAITKLSGREVEAQITVDQPQMQSPGSYTVIYTAVYEGLTATKELTVNIVDTQAPVITLTYEPDAFTEPGCEYVEEGYSAWDNVDGDLTDRVVRTEEAGTVIYTVTDSSGNATRVERSIVYDDRTAPELVLLGEETVTITAGTQFQEPGYTATDNVDGDITVNVTVNAEYNINVPGNYTIHYSVSDSHGNTAEADRGLVVEDTQPPETEPTQAPEKETTKPTTPQTTEPDYSGMELWNDPDNPTDKVIYLTFDDGPGTDTMELLSVLKKYNVKVTFFVVGTACLEYLDDIAAAGHTIGLHSNTHNYSKIYKSKTAFFEDLYALQDKVYEYCGVRSWIYRFPGGSSNSVSKKYCTGIMTTLVDAVEEAGFTYFDWNVDSNDAGGAKTANQVYKNVISGVKGRRSSVVLQHDVKSFSVNAVEKIIQWGLANGYTFLPLDENSPTAHHSVNN